MTDVRGACAVRLIQDPELGGDLLLVALGLAAVYDFGLTYENGIHGIGDMLWAGSHDPHWKVREVFKRDIRTYRVEMRQNYRCGAPMVRRDGACGKSSTYWALIGDWATGEKARIVACSRHRDWFEHTRRANLAAKPDIVPLPYANAGGLLVKHFPRVDWPRFWKDLDPKWVQHPEREELPKPDLRLVLGKGLDDRPRGSLVLVTNGGEW